MKQKRGSKAKRRLLWLCGCALVLVLAGGGFEYWINITPQIDIPTPVMPHPNGYDFFLRAAAAYVKDSKGVDEITDHSMLSKPKQYPIEAKEAWLHQNAKALQLLREGLKYPALFPPATSIHQIGLLRDLARALAVESHVRAARGDWHGAADSALDDLEFSYDISRGGLLIAGLVGDAGQAISLREMYHVSPHLDAKAASLAAKRMEHLYDGRFPYFKTMQEEKWVEQKALLARMSEHSWRWKTIYTISETPIFMMSIVDPFYTPPSRLEIAEVFLKNSTLFFISKRRILNDYTNGIDAYIANGQIPYIKMRPVSASGDRFANMLLSGYGDMRWNWARTDAYSVLDMTMLALRAFRLEKGHYPASLKELVPQYLQKVPIDPFTSDAPPRYQLQGQKNILWSIGPDGIDNHGTPTINRDRRGAASYRLLEPGSKGDVVAGVNMP